MRGLKYISLLLILLTACGLSNTSVTEFETPTPADWQDRVRECVSGNSFLISLLPELGKYNSNTEAIEINTTLTPTSRGCITLPEDIYPLGERTFSSVGTAYLGYVSNWEPVCGGTQAAPLPGDCTGEGYEAGGSGDVTLVAKSNLPEAPNLIIHFTITPQATP